MRLTKSQIKDVTESLKAFDPLVVYLFGSHGTLTSHPGSDIDIALLPRVPVNAFEVFAAASRLSEQLGREVDLIDLSTSSTVLAKEVLRTGEPILAKDQYRQHDFEMRTLSDYARLNEERQECLSPAQSNGRHRHQ